MKKLYFLSLTLFTCCVKSLLADDLSISVDYLLWKAEQSTMTYGSAVNSITDLNSMQPLNQSTKHSSGVRVGAVYDLTCLWDAGFYWTHLNNDVTGSSSSIPIVINPVISFNAPLLVGGDGLGGPASSRWDLNFDTFDLNFGRTLFAWEGLEIRPLFGLKGAVINQCQDATYTNFFNTNTTNRVNAAVRQVNDFSGIGPKAGFTASYCLNWGIDLFGDFSAALLYGKHKSRTAAQVLELGTLTQSSFTEEQNKLIPTFQLSLGLNWKTCFCDCYQLFLGVAYETQYYWNTWRTRNSGTQDFFVTSVGYGDLMLHGVTFRVGVTF